MNEREIFEQAIEIQNPAERQAFLEQACGGDVKLRAQLDQLLASHQVASQFLKVPLVEQLNPPAQNPAPTIEVSSASVEAARQHASQPGDEEDESQPTTDLSFLQPSTAPGSIGRLGHYEILQVLGQGAFGIVFKAFDEKLHRHVAIKAINPQLAATSPPRKRFLREARSVAAIKHENIVQVYSVEEQPLPYLVMEYIDGQSLQQKLDGAGPLEVGEILHLGRQMAAGLAAAHEKGLIHRDIKPGNILLERGVEQRVKITDFGLARAADDATVTRTGMIAGTPMFMAPEQALGQKLDHRADLFSLGSVLYQMTCGRPPFRGPNAVAVLKRVVDETPRPIQDILPEIPDWLCAIIEKLQAKNRDERYASAQEVGNLLSHCLKDLQQGKTPLVAAPKHEPASLARPKLTATDGHRRSRQLLVAAAAVALMILIGLGVTEATGLTKLAATVIRITTGSGTLVVEADDPEVSVTIDGEELVILGGGVKEVRLKPGEYKLLASKDGQVVTQELVTITSGGRQVVRVSKEHGNQPSTTVVDSDRKAAEWVLALGGTVHLNDDPNHVLKSSDLPSEPFRLTGFHLRKPEVEDTDLRILQDCQHLTRIDLAFTGIGDAGLEFVSGKRPLITLDLLGTSVSDAGLARLAPGNELAELAIGSPLVTDAGIAKLGNYQHLKYLWLKGDKLTDSVLLSFKNCQNLGMVDIQWTPIGDEGIAHLHDCKNLAMLWARHSKVTARGVMELQAALLNCKVDWNDAPLDPDRRAAEYVLSIGGIVQVNRQDQDIKAIAALPKEDFLLTTVNLTNYQNVTDAGLAQLPNGKKLKGLDLRYVPLTDAGLAHLKDCQELEELLLDFTPVTDATLDLFKDRNVSKWGLIGTRVTDAGLANLENHTSLVALALDGTDVTDTGLAHLKNCKKLTHLQLGGTRITNAGLAHLKGLTALEWLDLNNTQVTVAGIEDLRAALPMCQIDGP
ncbi:MAG: protein kinase [Pirellulales bacterium]